MTRKQDKLRFDKFRFDKDKEILYSAGNNDECYTPAYGVKPILKYIPKDWVVWCPFDLERERVNT